MAGRKAVEVLREICGWLVVDLGIAIARAEIAEAQLAELIAKQKIDKPETKES